MNPTIHAKVRAVRRRLIWVRAIRRALIVAFWLAAGLSLLVLAGRFTLPVPPLAQAAPWAGGAGLLWLVIWMAVRRISLFEAAVRADEALVLKERLSTAMLIGQPRNPAEDAVIEDAVEHARQVRPSEVARLEFKRQLGFAAGSLLTLALLFLFMPTIDPFAKAKALKAIEKQKEEIRVEREKQYAELIKEAADTGEIKKPESISNAERAMKLLAKEVEERRIDADQAQIKLEKMTEKIKNRREEIQNRLNEAANTLNSRGEGRITNEVSKEMAKGQFDKAADKMQELQDKLAQNKLTDQEKSALAQEMKAMAQNLKDNPELAKALKQAAEQIGQGNTNSAQTAMQDAVKSMQNMQSLLNEMQALEKMEASMKGSARQMAQAGQSGKCPSCGSQLDKNGQCQNCGYKGEGQEGQNGRQGQQGQGRMQGQGEGDSDSQNQGQEGRNQGNRNGTGRWTEGPTDRQGGGMGSAGRGQGGQASRKDGQVQFVKEKVKGQMIPGEIVARFKVDGKQTPGEITAKYEGMALELAQQSEESIDHEAMPIEFKSLVRDYFAAIKRDGKANPPASAAAHQ